MHNRKPDPRAFVSIIYFATYVVMTAMKLRLDQNNIYFIPAALETLLMYYGFHLLKKEEPIYFKKLSDLYLYLLVIGSIFLIIYLFQVTLQPTIPFLILLSFMLAGFVVVILIWYRKVQLFKYFYEKEL
jgi:hypothetical protein